MKNNDKIARTDIFRGNYQQNPETKLWTPKHKLILPETFLCKSEQEECDSQRKYDTQHFGRG